MIIKKFSTSALMLCVLAGAAVASEPECRKITADQLQTLGQQDQLRHLTITRNPSIEKFSIGGLDAYNLEMLDIDLNNVEDASPIGHVPTLKVLKVHGAGSPMSDKIKTEIETALNLKRPIQALLSFEFLRYLKNLTHLEIHFGSLDLGVLKGHKNLQSVNLDYCDVAAPNPDYMAVFSTMPYLQELVFNLGREITTLDGLKGCKALKRLTIHFSNCGSLEPLIGLPITHLDLRGCNGLNLSPLAGLTQLETCELPGSVNQGWDKLINHPTLRRLVLARCDVEQPSPEIAAQFLACSKAMEAIDLQANPTPESLELFETFDKLINAPVGYPMEVLQTIPNLRVVFFTADYSASYINTFKEKRPEVKIIMGDRPSNWENIDLK